MEIRAEEISEIIKKQIKEYPLINGTKPYTAPYAEPYSASVDDKSQIVWTNDFSSSRIYRIDMNTGQSTEFMTPANYELRDLKVEVGADRGGIADRLVERPHDGWTVDRLLALRYTSPRDRAASAR